MDCEFPLHPPWFLLPSGPDDWKGREISNADFVDWKSVVWETEKTIEAHPERWGWLGKICPCGEAAVIWTKRVGYRCEKHFVDCPNLSSSGSSNSVI